MENKSRTRTGTVYLNSAITLICQILQILIAFVLRKTFIDTLGVSYLGYNSVFLNVLQMLNLADMGIGVAITSFLFKPLAECNKERVATLMYLYKKIYNVMGVIVLAIGLVISIFLGTIIPDASCSIEYLRVLFYINLIGTVSTYFLSYKRTLIIADQKSYITNLVDMVLFFFISIAQIICLLVKPNYIVYLLLGVARNLISNIIISIKCDKKYGKINKHISPELAQEYKPQIIQYVKDVFVSRIGATIFYGTDNVIISTFKGSLLAGYFSNYTMITAQLTTVISQVLASLQATFGNYIHSDKSIDEQRVMTNNYFCVNYIIGNYCMVCFILLVQPFIALFFGQTLTLQMSTAIWLGINLMLTMMIQLPSQVFIIYKLFRYDRPIIITSAALNIIISILLVKQLGIDGVLIGTFITSLIYLFSRFYIIAKHVYKVAYTDYLSKILLYFTISVATFFVAYFACKGLNGLSIKCFVVRMVLVALLSLSVPLTFLSFTNEFIFLKNKLIPGRARKLCNKYFLGGFSLLIIIASIFLGGIDQATFSTTGNKSYNRMDSYDIEANTGTNIFHLSFDDTFLLFKDINEKRYDSVFQNSTLNWYKELHDKYDVVISCYVYYEDKDFNLSQFPDKYKGEFIENSSWLRFGFHTINAETNYQTGDIAEDYQKTIKELERIVGSEAIDNVIRLQMFKGSYDGVKLLSQLENQSIVGMLTADDNRQSYYLSDEINNYIYCHDEFYDVDTGLTFYSTDFRTEYVDNISSKLKELSDNCWSNQTGDLVVFSHEWALSMENKEKIEKVCEYARNKGYRFKFFEDAILSN